MPALQHRLQGRAETILVIELVACGPKMLQKPVNYGTALSLLLDHGPEKDSQQASP